MARTRNSGNPTARASRDLADAAPVRLTELEPAERRLARGAALALSTMVVSLRVLGFQRTLAWLRRVARRKPTSSPAAPFERARRIAELVELANRRYSPLAAACLPRSMALAWLLNRRGIDNELRIGVRTRTGMLQAHAWVEVEGRPLSEVEDVQQTWAAFDLPPSIARLVSE